MIKNNLILELIKFEIKKKGITLNSFIEKKELNTNCDNTNVNVTIDISSFEEELIISELEALCDDDIKWITITDESKIYSGFANTIEYAPEDESVSLSIPLPYVIELLKEVV